MELHIGMSDEQRKSVAQGLSKLLADSYMLYLKTHNFHWNVTGPHFSTLHTLFETHYTELATAVDEIAERIRALGEFAPGSFSAFAELTTIDEENGRPNATDMIQQLIVAQEEVIRTARHMMPTAEAANDAPTVDLITRRMLEHEKNAWMLRSLLED